jgi:hypothetical protein
MLPCISLAGQSGIPELFASPPLKLVTDWHKHPAPYETTIYFALSPEYLLYGAEIKKDAETVEPRDEAFFVEGLWEADVIELFLADDHSAAYQEFNLSPDGRWWSCRFSSYRKRDPRGFRMPQNVRREYLLLPGCFKAGIQIPRTELSVDCSFGARSRAHLCAIAGRQPRVYYSTAPLESEKPDFHDPRCFQAIHFPEQPHV